MASEVTWPPKSPRAALLSSPSGRMKYLSAHPQNMQRSPQKHSAKSSDLLDRLRAARTNDEFLEESDPIQEDDEDEETLKLQLAAIEAKLKLKKLQQSKTKSDVGHKTPGPPSCRPSSASDLGTRPSSAQIAKNEPYGSANKILVGLSPSKKSFPAQESRSPSRILLGIDKGLKGSDVSLRRARTTVERSQSQFADAPSLVTSRFSGLGSQRSTTKSNQAGSIQSFGERMIAVRENDKSRDAQRLSAAVGRSKGFKIDQREVDGFRQLAEERSVSHQTPVRPGSQQAYSREEILKAKENVHPGSTHLRKSRTTDDLGRSPSRPSTQELAANAGSASSTPPANATLFEGFSSLHLSSRVLPHSFLKRTLAEDQFSVYRIPDLLREIKSPEYELPNGVGDYVVFGVIASKSSPRDHKQKVEEQSIGSNDWERKWEDGSQNQRKFIAMTLTDLDWSLDLYLFGTAVPRYHRLTPGTVVAILNPSIMPPRKGAEDTGAFSLTLHDGDDTILEIGTAKHLGHCNALRKDGKECGQWVNASKTEICEWHLNLQLAKTQSGRMGVNTGSNGTKLNSRNFIVDSRLKGNRAGEKRLHSLAKGTGEKYDCATESTYFISNPNPGFTARSRQSSVMGGIPDPDDPFISEGQLSRSREKKALLKIRKERREKEEEIARKLSTFDSGTAGSDYLRRKTGAATPVGGQRLNSDGVSRSSAQAIKANIMRSISDSGGNRKRAAESVRLSPVKRTRFVTEKGIRIAGRESLGVTNVDEDDDLDIV